MTFVGFDVAMSSHAAVLDVAGITVEVAATTDAHLGCVTSRVGTAPGEGRAELRMYVGPDAPAPPDREPDQHLEGYDGWDDGDDMWIAQRRSALRVGAGEIRAGGPLDDVDDVDTLDNLLQFGIALAVARPDRLMIHGAVVARHNAAIAVIGRSGAGKSTLAAAAMLDGWELLGDDLALVTPAERRIEAVRRPPMLPTEIAAPHGIEGRREEGGRERTTLSVDVLRPGAAELVAVVAVAHGTAGGVERLPGGDPGVLDDALALPPFRSAIRRQLAPAAAMVALPTFALFHARDPERRVARAQASLDEVLAACRDQ